MTHKRDVEATAELRFVMTIGEPGKTMKDLAATLGVSENTLYVWQQKGAPEAAREGIHELYERIRLRTASSVCIYNDYVECSDDPKICKQCGWKPEVAAKRSEDWRAGVRRK